MESGPHSPAEKLTLVLVDDHAVVRSALKVLLESEPDLEVVAEAGTADDAIRYVGAHKPDVLVLDLNMPGRPSLEAVPDIQAASPDTKIVILTMRNEPAFARLVTSSFERDLREAKQISGDVIGRLPPWVRGLAWVAARLRAFL